ncbi:hypothetical protein GGR43_003650 [Sphingobium jiangsuense]|uniref:Recombinase domain-containing protein n=1 Tax=Sphingobium jiangsuense TaxID=870476 RepID=A0A7W6FR88_9SPHN|nr:hypothetical protein [Sphingobium jiangsuense]
MSGISQQNSRHQKRTAHGVSFQRGALFALLSNRIYLGETAHKGTAYPGDHEALIDRELWDKVQALIARAISAVRPVMRTRRHFASPSREAIRARRSFSKRSSSACPASWASSYPAPIHRGGVGLQCWQGIGQGTDLGCQHLPGGANFPVRCFHIIRQPSLGLCPVLCTERNFPIRAGLARLGEDRGLQFFGNAAVGIIDAADLFELCTHSQSSCYRCNSLM